MGHLRLQGKWLCQGSAPGWGPGAFQGSEVRGRPFGRLTVPLDVLSSLDSRGLRRVPWELDTVLSPPPPKKRNLDGESTSCLSSGSLPPGSRASPFRGAQSWQPGGSRSALGAVPGVLEFAEASLADSGGMPGQTSNPVPGPEVVPIICLWNEHFYRWKAPT